MGLERSLEEAVRTTMVMVCGRNGGRWWHHHRWRLVRDGGWGEIEGEDNRVWWFGIRGGRRLDVGSMYRVREGSHCILNENTLWLVTFFSLCSLVMGLAIYPKFKNRYH